MLNLMRFLFSFLSSAFSSLKQRINLKTKHVYIAKGSYIDPSAEIGRYTRINHISHIGPCKIGAFCAFGGRTVIRSSNHSTSYLNMQDWAQNKIILSNVRVAGKTKGQVVIGNAVWIGDSVIILPGVTIGDGAVIGAGSVVTKQIPAYSIAVGNPARVLRKRFSNEIIETLTKVDWWNWDVKTIRKRKYLFEIDLESITVEELRKTLDDLVA